MRSILRTVSELISSDPEVLGGTPVFAGTRVPVRTLFEYLEDNYTLEQFLEYFPTVSRELALSVLNESENALLAKEDPRRCVFSGPRGSTGAQVLAGPANLLQQP